MKKRTLALLLAMAMVLTCIMSGCGGSNDNSSQASSAPAASSQGGTESKTESEPVTSSTNTGAEDYDTEVGTPRSQTLIVECSSPTDTPGQFNSYMSGTQMGFGIHQLMVASMWEMDTVKGEQFGEVAAGMPEPNADFTEFTVPIRQGIKWSDGEDLNAEDVVFTFNMILTNENIGANGYAKTYIKSVEAVDEYTVKFTMTEPFPRLAQRFGVTVWGTDYRIVPEHVYSQQADVTTFKDENPVVAGPYTVNSYDPLGKWILYELREDWQQSTLGVAGKEVYGYTGNETLPKYVWFRNLGDDTTRQMLMIQNDVDLMVEVTPEQLTTMIDSNPNVAAWYSDFPYATSDDPCSKGLVFSQGQGAPYNDANFRWGMTLLLDIDQISENIFDGVGRASAIPIITATSAMSEFYYKPMLEWLENFELDLGDGTKFKPFDTEYKNRMAEKLRAKGYDIPDDDESLTDMFGIGWWKHDEAAAEKLLNKAGLTKENGKWMYNGEPFKFNMTYIADTETQGMRGCQAAYNQWLAAGFDVTISSDSTATWDTNGNTGNYFISSYWPSGGIMRDIYSAISGYDDDLYAPMGETGSGQNMRWYNAEATEIVHKMANLDPDSEENYELGIEWCKLAVQDMPMISFLSGVKFVPTNSTYWTGYPDSENAYDGPWWWWSRFKYVLPNLTSTIS